MLDWTDSIIEAFEDERRKGREQTPLKTREPIVVKPVDVAPAAATNDPIDRKHLARYTLGDVALELEVLSLFAQSLPQMTSALAEAADATAWRNAAHSLKGSARAIGAWSLADAAARAETVQNTDASGRKEVIAAVRHAARHVEDAIARETAAAS